jgi:hypothetical protein
MKGGPSVRNRAPAAVAVFGLALAYFALFVAYGINLDDEGTLLAQIYRTAQGEVPYRDFHMGYTPGGHYYHAWLMQLFGPSVLPLRWSLAVCNALVAALLFVIGRRVMSGWFAVLPAAAYCALMQVYPGDFATFNIPYPAWYVVLFGVAGFWMLLCYVESRRLGWIAAAGLVTGICFAFKPNVGLFQLAGSGLVLLVALEPPAGGRAPRWEGAVWWLLLFGVLGGLFFVFASQASQRDFNIFLLPIVVLLVMLAARRLAQRSSDLPRHGLIGSGLLFTATMLLAVVPWVVIFLRLIGVDRFARQILFVGTGFEQYYYMGFHTVGPWDLHLVRGILVLTLVGVAVRARLVPAPVIAALGVLGLIGAVLVAARANMPQGLHAAVFSRLEDLSFSASLLVHWMAIAALVPVIWARHRSRTQRTHMAILAGAFAMYLQLYPRSDFTHLVNAVPLTLVLAAALTSRFTMWFPEVAGVRRGVRVAVVGAAVALLAFRVSPNLTAHVRWQDGPAWRPLTGLALDRLPVLLELGREPRLRALHDTVEYLRVNTRPGEPIFPFPSIELLCFLADRPNATRHGYFFPGWPGHDVEAEVVSALRAAPPRLVVALQIHPYFFIDAPVYYYALRDFVRTNYRQVASFREFAVLARNDVDASTLTMPAVAPTVAEATLASEYGAGLEAADEGARLAATDALAAERLDFAWPPLVARLDDPSRAVRNAAVAALSGASRGDVAAALADAFQRKVIPPESRLAVLRRLWATGDTRIVRPLLEVLPVTTDVHEQNNMLGALDATARKLNISDHWFGDWRPPDLRPEDFPRLHRLRRQLADPAEDHTLRHFLGHALPRLGRARVAPALWIALGSSHGDLRYAAALGLMRLGQDGRGIDLIDVMLPQIGTESRLVPSMIFEMYRRDPSEVRRRLVRILRLEADAHVFDKIAVGWVAAATGDPAFRDELVRLVGSRHRELRLAGLTGLERLADPSTRRVAEAALTDPDFAVRDFAARAVATIPAAP